MASPLLYVDIRESGLMACRGEACEDGLEFIRFDEVAAVAEPVEGDAEQDLKATLALLSDRIDLSGCRRAVVLFPPSWISFRHTPLPFRQEKKIRQVLPMELVSCLPDPDVPVLTDFFLPEGPSDPGQFFIFSASLPEDKMAVIHGGLAELGIQPVLAVPRGLAHAAAFRACTPECEDFLYIHSVDRETTLTVFRNGRPLLIRPLICREGVPEMNRLALECRRTFISAGLMVGNGGRALDGMTLVVQGLGETEARTFGEAVSVGPADTINIEPSPFPAALTPDGRLPFLFNFCIGHYRPDSFAGRHRISLSVCVLLAVLAFGLNLAGVYRQNTILEAQVEQVRQMSGAVYAGTFPGAKQVQAAPLLLMESRVKQAKSRGADRGGEHERRQVFSVMDILTDLSGRIPAQVDMDISRLALNHGRLVLTGTTGNFNDVDRIKGLIQGAPGFKSVTINSAEADKTGKRVRFKFIVDM